MTNAVHDIFQATETIPNNKRTVYVNGESIDVTDYLTMHEERITRTLAKVAGGDVQRAVELGALG